MMSFTHSICVFCGARPGNEPKFTQDANETGKMIANEGWRLVFGAGDMGLMGKVAQAARDGGAPTLGVIPAHLIAHEQGHHEKSGAIITQDMHERKKVMFMNSDAVVVLPGGAGSLDEFFEMLTWRQIGLHQRQIFLLDTNSYWQPLITLLEHVIASGFADQSMRDFVTILPDVASLREVLRKSFNA
jgi:uncharacterized protein (TIGR00730 family)